MNLPRSMGELDRNRAGLSAVIVPMPAYRKEQQWKALHRAHASPTWSSHPHTKSPERTLINLSRRTATQQSTQTKHIHQTEQATTSITDKVLG
jgi:hypothetical protein